MFLAVSLYTGYYIFLLYVLLYVEMDPINYASV